MKLLIRNLARSTTEAELRTLFEDYGKVQSCTLVMDQKSGVSKGFGFVEMPKPGEAKAAMKSLNGRDVDGNKIRVKKAEAKPEPATRLPRPMREPSKRDPLHGVTLEALLTKLVDEYGWDELGRRIRIKCFTSDPSIASSLKFLRKTPWARHKVEALYLHTKWPVASVWPTAGDADES